MADEAVLQRALNERRLLLTGDKDFGELVFNRGAQASCGIVLVRVRLPPQQLGRFVVNALASRSDWVGHFTVLEPARMRVRPLPESSEG